MEFPGFSERLRRRHRLWWGALRPSDPRSWRERVHREREWRTLRSRDDPEAAWRCCQHWPRPLIQKWNGREFAARHGVPQPELYWRGYPWSRLPFAKLPASFVVRPVQGFARRGLYVMVDGRELLRQKAYSPGELARCLRQQRPAAWTLPILVEEYVRSPGGNAQLPVEYKCYSFGGVVAAVAVMHRAPAGAGVSAMRHYTANWEPFREVFVDKRPEPELEDPPEFLSQMVSFAERLGAAAGGFLRIDFFASDRGCLFNEFSSVPGGGQGYTAAADDYLGAAWQRHVPAAV